MAKSRGKRRRSRRQRSHKAAANLPKNANGESTASRAYSQGRSWGYTGRIKGPIGEVTIIKVDPNTM